MFTEEFDYDRAIEIAKEEGIVSSIKKLMKNLELTAEAAMEVLEIPKSDYPKYIAML